jgi:hypothetical protein
LRHPTPTPKPGQTWPVRPTAADFWVGRRGPVTSGGEYLPLVALPAYIPDYNADEAIWTWSHAEVTANTCWGTAGRVRAELDRFFVGLAERADQVRQRCRSQLQADLAAWVVAEHGHLNSTRSLCRVGVHHAGDG